jgi:hypothetical protein
VLAVGLAAWALASGSSQAQAGSMQNCPPAGMWSISVWDGESGTAAADALATCAGAVDAAYSLDAQTGDWWRWFAGKPGVSDLPPLADMQGVLALGSAARPTPTPTPSPTPTATPTGEAGYLPPPQDVGHISAGGNAVVTTSNDTPYTLTVEFQGPTAQTITIARCDTCHEYSFIGPFSCPSGRPEETVTLPPGDYTVTARVDDPTVNSFVGDWTLDADTEYFQCLYIVTTFG